MSTTERTERETNRRWPSLEWSAWADTCDTLHLWMQMVGKVKLKLCPFLNHDWQVALHLTARGLTTSTMPYGGRQLSIDFDFIDHTLVVQTDDGQREVLHLSPRSVADFYRELMAALSAVGMEVAINPKPAEIPGAIPFHEDRSHASYDPEYVRRWWQILLQTEQVLNTFRTSFTGKSSPVQLYWGGFDLSEARFSGRAAEPPAGAPRFLQRAENRENYACGFWPGNMTMWGITLAEPAFYAYHYPEPPGFREASVRPEGAYFDTTLGEFILPYERVRQSSSPEQAILDFVQSTYEASASLAQWDRHLLELTEEELP